MNIFLKCFLDGSIKKKAGGASVAILSARLLPVPSVFVLVSLVEISLARNFVLCVLLVCQDVNMPPKQKVSVTGDHKLKRKTMTLLEKVKLCID